MLIIFRQFLFLLILPLTGCTSMYEYNVRTHVVSGEELVVNYAVEVDEPIFTIPHVMEIGGGDPSLFVLDFSYAGNHYQWQGSAIPVVLQFQQAKPYLVGLDRESAKANIQFKYFVYDVGWQTISHKDFPKSIAIQNLWSYEGASPETARDVPYAITTALRHNEKNYIYERTPEVINPTEESFKSTLTAILWVQLEKDLDYDTAKNVELPSQFYVDFYNKYIEKPSRPEQ